MTWQPTGTMALTTESGNLLDIVCPFRRDQIRFDDIIHGCAHATRYGSQAKRTYRVGQHSVGACWLARILYPGDRILHAAVLFHDGSEGYTGDMTTPFKRSLPDFTAMERELQEAIEDSMNLPRGISWCPAVEGLDKAMLVLEWPELMSGPCPDAGARLGQSVLDQILELPGGRQTIDKARPTRLNTWSDKTARVRMWDEARDIGVITGHPPARWA